MVGLVNFKESIIHFYQKREDIIRPFLRIILSLFVLFGTQQMLRGAPAQQLALILVGVSVIQAFLPTIMLYFSASALAMYHLYNMSPDLFLGFFILFLIALLTYIRIDGRTACITVVIPVLFMLRLQYLIPVALGITIGFAGVFPAVFGTLFYYMFHYAGEAGNLLSHTSDSDMGVGLSRVVDLMLMDKEILIILVTFSLVIFITALLYRMFYELAWFLSVAFGNVAMAFLLLCGRYIFELNNEVWLFLVEAVASILLCTIIQFFRGIGDVSRMEKTTFEDDDYIYYVKVVPKIKVTQENRNVTDISSENAEKIEAEQQTAAREQEDLAANRKRRTERKKSGFFGRKKEQKTAKDVPAEWAEELEFSNKELTEKTATQKDAAKKDTAEKKTIEKEPAQKEPKQKESALKDKDKKDSVKTESTKTDNIDKDNIKKDSAENNNTEKDNKETNSTDRTSLEKNRSEKEKPDKGALDKDISDKDISDTDTSDKEAPDKGAPVQKAPQDITRERPPMKEPAAPGEEPDLAMPEEDGGPARRRKKKKGN